MTAYEDIYKAIVAQYGDDNAFAFFNQHERDVIRRKAQPIATLLMSYLRRAVTANKKLARDAAFHRARSVAEALASLTGADVDAWLEAAEREYTQSGNARTDSVLAARLIVELFP